MDMKIGEVYGISNNKISKSFSTSGKSMFISFQKYHDWWDGVVKFTALFKYNSYSFDCQSWLSKSILMSPNHPNINCSWVITASFGSYIILNFEFIEVVNFYY